VTGGAASAPGTLYVVSTPIGNLGDLSARAREVLGKADILACEDTRRTGRLLELAGISQGARASGSRLVALHAHNEAERAPSLVASLLSGKDVALVADAGTPVVADPGARLVAQAAAAGVRVVPVPGPSAALALLAACGLPASRWRFDGFLPRRGARRAAILAEIAAGDLPSVVYESPHRLAGTLADLLAACGPERRIVLGRELTKLHEEIWRGTLAQAVARAAGDGGSARGEHVLVVDAAPGEDKGRERDLVEPIERLLAAGLGRRDAAVAASVLLGAPRHDAYEAALRSGRS
jgi:16S rRNA (cytidine1402-2'-O)-methyltransferase